MTTSSEELRAKMRAWFDDIDAGWPLAFLISHGYTCIGGVIRPPTFSHNVSSDEDDCIQFLFEEWDFEFRRNKD